MGCELLVWLHPPAPYYDKWSRNTKCLYLGQSLTGRKRELSVEQLCGSDQEITTLRRIVLEAGWFHNDLLLRLHVDGATGVLLVQSG